MGARAITRIVTAEGVSAFALYWGSPEFQMPRIAQFLLMLDLSGEPVTADAWRAFAADTTRADGEPVVANRQVDPDAVPSDTEHLYVINATDPDALSFAYYYADPSPYALGRWAVKAEADTLAEVLALAVRYAELVARRSHRLAWVDNEARAAAEQWATNARRMVLVHQSSEDEHVTPAADELPPRRDEDDRVEHARAVAEFCAARAEELPTDTEQARREARGWTRTAHRYWLATL